MKFTIITHAVHKIKGKNIYAYEPYVREMNLWLKHVDEVEIVAPVSDEEITSIESKYQFKDRHCERSEAISSQEQIATSQTCLEYSRKAPRNDENQCHPELVEGFQIKNESEKSLRQAQTDNEKSEAISSQEQIATSRTPSYDEQEKQVAKSKTPRNDEQEKQITSSSTPRNDENQCHTEPVEGCREANNKKDKSNRVGLDEMEYDSNENESKVKSLRQAQTDNEKSEAISSKEQIATSHTPCNDEQECHTEPVEVFCNAEPIILFDIPSFDSTSIKNAIKTIFKIPKILFVIYKAMNRSDHIHLRCPGNVGLLGCFVQILFPNKPKTIKYAGNWDPNSKQPLSYRFQKWILSNTFLTRKAKVLVYGEWSNQTKNIVPFFTASYLEHEIEQVDLEIKIKSLRQAQTDNTVRHNEQGETISSNEQIVTSYAPRNDETERHPEPVVEGFDDLQEKTISLRQAQTDNEEDHREHSEAISSKKQIASLRTSRNDEIDNEKQIATSKTPRNDESEHHPEPVEGSKVDVLKIIFVGGLTPGKQPLLPVQVVHKLKEKGFPVKLDIYGEGEKRTNIEKYIKENNLHKVVVMHGNADKETIKKAYQQAHFLIFISKSEGWPKVVAEAMFWGCVPITSGISCIPYMLNKGTRGTLVSNNLNEIVLAVEDYLSNLTKYLKHGKEAMQWSQKFTLDKFEEETKKLLL